jgi:O-antigen/teichoic acid export membrane protein
VTDDTAATEVPFTVASELGHPPPPADAGPGAIARRSVWGLLAQVTPLAVNIGLSPYVIHGFGLDRYGLFLLITGLATLLGSFDGGITASAQRYFSIYAGAGDKHATTRLLCTTTTLVGAAGLVIAAAMWALATPITHLLTMPPQLGGETVFLLRVSAVILVGALLRNVPAAILQAHNRFALTNLTYALSYGIYVAGIILTVHNQWGLRGAALTIAAQQVVATIVIVPSSLQYLTRSGVGFYSRPELRELFAFSAKMQSVSIAQLFLAEVDGMIIAALLPVRNVALYTAGAGFSEQIRTVPSNALGPMQTALAHSYAQRGEEGLYPEFEKLQRTWVLGITGWCAAATGAAYFGVTSWLGHGSNEFHVSGIVATVLLVGVFAMLGTRVLSTTLTVLGHPGFQARLSIMMVIVNISLTACLVWFGPVGVVAATTLSQIAGVVYLEHSVRRRHPVRMRSFVHDVPVLAYLVTIATVFALEVLIHPYVPYGAVGLLSCAVPAMFGLLVYAHIALPRETRHRVYGRVWSTAARLIPGRAA